MDIGTVVDGREKQGAAEPASFVMPSRGVEHHDAVMPSGDLQLVLADPGRGLECCACRAAAD